jgi:hypothetical protein
MSGQGKGKRLNDAQRAEIIHKLQKPNPPSKQSIAKEYGLSSENAVHQIMKNADVILERVRYGSETGKHTYCATNPQYPVVEEKLLRWIDALCRKKCASSH